MAYFATAMSEKIKSLRGEIERIEQANREHRKMKHPSKGENMKIKLLLCVILAGCAFGFAKSKAEVRDVTGCLSRGDSAKEYLLTGNDGSTWEVRSSRVVLGKHVGHMVTATGVVSHSKMHNMKEDAKQAAKDSGMKKSDAEHGHMTITDVKMVSDSCQK